MSVVARDQHAALRAIRPRVAWGVVLDAEQLWLTRQTRTQRENFALTHREWVDSPTQTRLQRDLANGAWLVGGIPPGLLLWQELETALRSATKAREVWPSLLDTRIPFPLEQCHCAFLPCPDSPTGSKRSTAAVIRHQDLTQLLETHQVLGLDPHLFLPEAPALAGALNGDGLLVWCGPNRASLLQVNAGRVTTHAAVRNPAHLLPALQRFLRAVGGASGPVHLCGPAAETFRATVAQATEGRPWSEAPALPDLSALLASAALRPRSNLPNLRVGDQAHPALARRERRETRRMASLALLALALPLALTAAGLQRLDQLRRTAEVEVRDLHQALTGHPPPAPGQEVLTATRALDAAWEQLRPALARAQQPGPSALLARVLHRGLNLPVRLHHAQGTAAGLDLEVEGDAAALVDALRAPGWTASEPVALENGHQRLRVEFAP